jgi:hypothetical protein
MEYTDYKHFYETLSCSRGLSQLREYFFITTIDAWSVSPGAYKLSSIYLHHIQGDKITFCANERKRDRKVNKCTEQSPYSWCMYLHPHSPQFITH